MAELSNAEIILLTGGARSGKSEMAIRLAAEHASKTFVATAEPLDQEMVDRIRRHKQERTPDWVTIEEPLYLVKVLESHPDGFLVLDCITLWLSNMLMRSYTEVRIRSEIVRLCQALQSRRGTTVVVTNEVGMGIVPEQPSTRLFRDLAGYANQQIAKIANKVTMMVSGLPLVLR